MGMCKLCGCNGYRWYLNVFATAKDLNEVVPYQSVQLVFPKNSPVSRMAFCNPPF